MSIEWQDGYRAGACNIGPAEIRRRRLGALVGVLGTIALGAVMVLADVPRPVGILLGIPLSAAIINLEQVRRRFCVAFALSGLRNMGAGREVEAVGDPEERAADRRSALWMVAYGGALGFTLAVAFALLLL